MAESKSDIAARLLALDTPAVSDALDRLGLKGTVIGLLQLSTDRRIAGRIHTVKLGTGAALQGPARHLCTASVEASAPGDILVIEQRSGINAAGWGGILSNAAKVAGIAGVICDGPVRDVVESRDLDFPVFARSATPTTARGRIVEEAFDEPVEIGDVTVRPGDYVIADASGVVFVAQDRADEIVKTAEKIAAREAAMTRDVLAGKPVSQVMDADYENMLDE
jgi:4-hydroxy-4-methyl-2-oxoglutarate aldolase